MINNDNLNNFETNNPVDNMDDSLSVQISLNSTAMDSNEFNEHILIVRLENDEWNALKPMNERKRRLLLYMAKRFQDQKYTNVHPDNFRM